MAHSFVEFRDQIQLMHDIEIVTVVHIVLDTFRDTSNLSDITRNIEVLLHSWRTLIDTYGPGCLDIDFNQYVLSKADQDCLLKLLKLSRRVVQNLGPVVSGDFLNRVVDAQGVLEFVDRPTADVLSSFDKFIKLIHADNEDERAAGQKA